MKEVILLHPTDDVVIAVQPLQSGDIVAVASEPSDLGRRSHGTQE